MAVTIKDVAREAGVSVSTVSKVLSDNKTITEATKAKVRAVIEELRYVPNQNARNLVTQSSKNVALLLDYYAPGHALVSPYTYETINGIESVLAPEGYSLTMHIRREGVTQCDTIRRLYNERRIDGVIFMAENEEDALAFVQRHKVPYIIVGQPGAIGDEVVWVDTNNFHSAGVAASHLIEAGYKRPAVMAYETESSILRQQRVNGFKLTMQSFFGVPPREYYCATNDEQEAYALARQMLAEENPPDCVLGVSNLMAAGILRAAKSLGVRIGQDFGIITFDSHPLALYLDPPISSIEIDVYNLGISAGLITLNLLTGGRLGCRNPQVKPTTLIQRASTQRG